MILRPSPISTKPRTKPILSSSKPPDDVTTTIRVCVNRTCARQGSRAILEVLAGIAPSGIAVASCSCLGRCGAGPNLAVVPPGSVVGHCGTSARAARVLEEICGGARQFDAGRSLEALALRMEGEKELEKGDFVRAEALVSKALELEPSGGLHLMYRCRSAARLGKGNNEGALHDAEESIKIAPNFSEGYICQGDAFFAMGELAAAEKAYSDALLIDPSIRRSKSFKVNPHTLSGPYFLRNLAIMASTFYRLGLQNFKRNWFIQMLLHGELQMRAYGRFQLLLVSVAINTEMLP